MADEHGAATATVTGDPVASDPKRSEIRPQLGIGNNPELLSALLKKKKQAEAEAEPAAIAENENANKNGRDTDEGYEEGHGHGHEAKVAPPPMPVQACTSAPAMPPPMPTDDGIGKDVFSVGVSADEFKKMENLKPIQADIVNKLANLKTVTPKEKEGGAEGDHSSIGGHEPMNMMAELGKTLRTAPTAMTATNIDEKVRARKEAKAKASENRKDHNGENGQATPAWLTMDKVKRRRSTPAESETDSNGKAALAPPENKGIDELKARLERRRTLNGEIGAGSDAEGLLVAANAAAATKVKPPPPKVMPKPKPKPLPPVPANAEKLPKQILTPTLNTDLKADESAQDDRRRDQEHQEQMTPSDELPPPPDFLLHDEAEEHEHERGDNGKEDSNQDEVNETSAVPLPQDISAPVPPSSPTALENCEPEPEKEPEDVRVLMPTATAVAPPPPPPPPTPPQEPVQAQPQMSKKKQKKKQKKKPKVPAQGQAPPPPPPPPLPRQEIENTLNVGNTNAGGGLPSDLLSSIRAVNKNTFLKKGSAELSSHSQTSSPDSATATAGMNTSSSSQNQNLLIQALAKRAAAFQPHDDLSSSDEGGPDGYVDEWD